MGVEVADQDVATLVQEVKQKENAAHIYLAEDRYQEAEPLLRQALELVVRAKELFPAVVRMRLQRALDLCDPPLPVPKKTPSLAEATRGEEIVLPDDYVGSLGPILPHHHGRRFRNLLEGIVPFTATTRFGECRLSRIHQIAFRVEFPRSGNSVVLECNSSGRPVGLQKDGSKVDVGAIHQIIPSFDIAQLLDDLETAMSALLDQT